MKILKSIVAAFALQLCGTFPLFAQQSDLDDLFNALKTADVETAQPIADKIWDEWSKSGSPAMDLLLKRGRNMMEQGDLVLAIEHFSALIDHAPEFAEGYNMRATALFQLQRYGESLADIRMALALNPRHFGAMSGLAGIQEDLGFEVDALATWRRVKEIYPAQPHVDAAIARLGVNAMGVEI